MEEDTLWRDFKVNYVPNYSLKINIIDLLDQVLKMAHLLAKATF